MEKKIALVGYTGFVGSNLLQFYKFDKLYNSKNFYKAKNKTFDKVFFCGLPANKWMINNNPTQDEETINEIKNILSTIKANKFILISTIDVYENTNQELDEDYKCNPQINHTYGKHRFLFEQYIQTTFTDHHIVRLPALFGKGLKKNIIYDLLNNNNINQIFLDTSFQWYNLDWLYTDINVVVDNNIKICNLFTENIETNDIIKLFSYDLSNNKSKNIIYNCCTKYGHLFNGNKYIRNKTFVLDSIKHFIDEYKIKMDHLCISNIANNLPNKQFYSLIKLFGYKYIEVAPTKFLSWDNFNIENFNKVNDKINKYGLTIYSFQSVTFTLNDYNIFNENQNKLYEHLINVIIVATHYKISVIVFGCPRNRFVINKNIDNEIIFVEFFKKLGPILEKCKIKLCLENNSKKYNCNFGNTVDEIGELVELINHPNICKMVDTGNCIMENDVINVNNTHHIHIAEPFMNPFVDVSSENVDVIFKIMDYKNKITLEMLPCELSDFVTSLSNFKTIFGKL